MRPRLKEEPREWRKFAGASAVAGLILDGLLVYRAVLSPRSGVFLAGVVMVAVAAGLVRPQWIRPFYRFAMTVGFYIGQVVGRVLLAVLFVLVVVPVGLGLRLAGKDLLQLRRGRPGTSYWRRFGGASPFDRQF
jgi:hypothetical protein